MFPNSPEGMTVPVSPEEAIVAAYAAGEPVGSIAARYRVAPEQIESLIARLTGPPMPYPPAGYPFGSPVASYPAMMTPRPASGAAVAALVVGIVTVLGGFVLVLPVLLTWLLAHRGLRETRTGVKSGWGLAIAGNVLGWVGFVLAALFIAVVLASA